MVKVRWTVEDLFLSLVVVEKEGAFGWQGRRGDVWYECGVVA